MPASIQVRAVVVPLSTSSANKPSSVKALAGRSSKPLLSPLFLTAACFVEFRQPVALVGSGVNVAVNVAVGGKEVLVAVRVTVGKGVFVGVRVTVGGKGVFVAVGVYVGAEVIVGRGVSVANGVSVGTRVAVAGSGVFVAVKVAVGGRGVLVSVGVAVGPAS